MKEQAIPKITHPLGKAWEQAENVKILFNTAWVTQVDFDNLLTYQHSQPSGVYEGKMWKRKEDDRWILCWYVNIPNGMCRVETLPLIIDEP